MKELKIINVDSKGSTGLPESQNPCCLPGTGRGIPLQLTIGEQRPDLDTLREKYDFVVGSANTPAGPVPKVSTEWSFSDRWGEIRSRAGAYRMTYSVPPGLYAIGEPDKGSDVFVSANYKLSFDKLRTSLKGMHGWILVLDTKSINVWCAAGKGNFSTGELINRIFATQLDKVVEHKKLIVPQLGAVGVNAATVKKRTKFKVHFGPVFARDIPDYIDADYKATGEMRTIQFGIIDRMILTPMEINPSMKKFPLFALIVVLLFGIQPSGILFKDAFTGGFPFIFLGLIAVFAGAFLTPTLLPYVPFRSFAIKGWIMGVLSVYITVNYFTITNVSNIYLLIMTYLFFPLMASYIALQFTGSTTYTGISGVKKELRIAIPVYVIAIAVSLVLALFYKLEYWGVV